MNLQPALKLNASAACFGWLAEKVSVIHIDILSSEMSCFQMRATCAKQKSSRLNPVTPQLHSEKSRFLKNSLSADVST